MLKKIFTYYVRKETLCLCFTDKVLKNQQGYVNGTETFKQRMSRTINNTEKGGSKVVFGILGESPLINSLGRIEGQLGGSGSALKNKF
jgi:hypothetical protein